MITYVDKTYVLDAIEQQKNGKAPGPDKVTVTFVVKDEREFIAHPLLVRAVSQNVV